MLGEKTTFYSIECFCEFMNNVGNFNLFYFKLVLEVINSSVGRVSYDITHK